MSSVENPPFTYVVGLGATEFKYEDVIYPMPDYFPDWYQKNIYTWKLSTSETDTSMSLGFSFTHQFRSGGWPGQDEFGFLNIEFGGTATLQKISDERTKAVEYRLTHATSTASTTGHTGFCVEGASPFGSSGDTLGGLFSTIRGFTEDKLKETTEHEDKMTARDEAIYDALNNLEIGSLNPIEEVNTLLAPLEPLMQLYKLAKIGSWIELIKNLASLHLFWKYVVKSGIMSIPSYKAMLHALRHPEDVINEIRKKGLVGHGKSKQTFSDDCQTTVVRHNAKLCYAGGAASFDNLLDLLNMLGFTPRIADLWDVVPYSFVLDWVIPLGDAINNLELNSIQQRLPFVYGVLGRKVETTLKREFEAGTHKYSLDLKTCSYTRTVIDEFPRDVWFGVSLHDPRKQLLTGGALIIQKLLS